MRRTESAQRQSQPLLHKGHSQDYRRDLWQYRQMLATLDPLGMPLISATLAGNGADDPLYFPTWKRLAKLLGHLDFLFLADGKASRWSNRAQIDREGGIYSFPLAMTRPRPKLLLDWVTNPPTRVTDIICPAGDEPVGQGFEVPWGSLWFDKGTQGWHRWSERWLVVQALSLGQASNKRIRTTRPTAEKLLVAFRGITLYFHRDGSTEISTLNFLQQQILDLIKIPKSI